ncbi:MAG: hypothetical protein E6J90_24295 [Deltaproteobacteria bacterium]|nr:MAG: hypothetical protein E6J90_24295 [Deltaproteobacteria bacterium]
MRLLMLVVALALCGCSYMRHPTPTTMWGKPVGTMVLGIEARGEVVNAFIENRGVKPQRIIAKGITLTIERQSGGGSAAGSGDGSGSGEVTKIMDSSIILLDREETFERLAPGEHLATPINVAKLGPGTYTVTATYTDRPSPTPGNWWVGTLTAGPITLVIP